MKQILAALIVFLPVSAFAAPITYLVDVDYSNGDELVGFFNFDASTSTLSNISLLLNDSSGATKNNFELALAGAPAGPSEFFFVDSPFPTPFVSEFAAIALDAPLTDLGGTFNVLPGAFDPFVASFVATCIVNPVDPNGCGLSPSFTVFATGGTVTGFPNVAQVPLPATAPLFLAGLVGLGFLARKKRRRLT
ncbi:MAG: PEP-CTERM sorting domain-containing protein [Pseudomonadota bacterium]